MIIGHIIFIVSSALLGLLVRALLGPNSVFILMGKLCRPLDQADWWKATAAIFFAGLGQVPVA